MVKQAVGHKLVRYGAFATAGVVSGLLFFTKAVDPSFVYVVLGTLGVGQFSKEVAK